MHRMLRLSSTSLENARARATGQKEKIHPDGASRSSSSRGRTSKNSSEKYKCTPAASQKSSPEVSDAAWAQFQEEIAERAGGSKKNIEGLFAAIDVNSDGTVSVKEMNKAFAKLGFKAAAKDIVNHIDADESGCVSLSEWMAAFREDSTSGGRRRENPLTACLNRFM